MSIKIGDFIQGTKNGYEHIKKGVVTDTNVESIKIKVLEHDQGLTFNAWVKSSDFKVIGHQKEFSRDEVLQLLMNSYKKAILDYDLRDANLRGANLRDADLCYANLRDADLCYANLSDANLSDANLSDANLRGADLRGADLRGADLRDADLCYANLRGADLRGADLRGANLDFSCYPLWCGGLHIKTDKRLACQLAYHLCSLQCDDTEFISMRNSILDFANQFHRVEECGRLLERSNDMGGESNAK